MSLDNLLVKKTYIAGQGTGSTGSPPSGGSSVEFPIPFEYFLQGDVKVVKTYGNYASDSTPETNIDNATHVISFATDHPFAVGQEVQLQTDGDTPKNVLLLTSYYVINNSATSIKLATTKQKAIDGISDVNIEQPDTLKSATIIITSQTLEVVLDLNTGFDLTGSSRDLHPTRAINLPQNVLLKTVHTLGSEESLTIIRDIDSDNGKKIGDIKQATELSTFGEGKQVEAAIDRNTAHIQELQEGVDRAIKIPVSYDEDVDLNLPAPEENTFIGWDSAGAKLINRAGTGTDADAVHVSGENTENEFVNAKTGEKEINTSDRILFEDASNSYSKAYDTVEGIIDLGVKTTPSDTVGNLDTKFEAPTGRGIDINTVANKIQITQLHTTVTDSPPTITPDYIGAIYVNQAAGEVWIAAGLTPSDWKKSATAASNTISGLSDTTITSPKADELLAYDATLDKWVNNNIAVKSGFYSTDGDYNFDNLKTLGFVENIYSRGTNNVQNVGQDVVVTLKQGTFKSRNFSLALVTQNSWHVLASFYGGNILTVGILAHGTSANTFFTEQEVYLMGKDLVSSYTKADGEAYGADRCPRIAVHGYPINKFAYNSFKNVKILVWQDSASANSLWFSISKDGYTFATRYFKGTQGEITSYGNFSVSSVNNEDAHTMTRPQIKIYDTTGDGNADTAYVSNVNSTSSQYGIICWKIDLSQNNPIDHITLLPYDNTRWAVLDNSGDVTKDGSNIYGNPQLQHDPVTNITVVACQTDGTNGVINATHDDSTWVNNGGLKIQDTTGGGSIDIQWPHNTQTTLMSAWSTIYNVNANDSRFVLIYTSRNATTGSGGAATGEDLMYASCDISNSTNPPTVTFNPNKSLVRQDTPNLANQEGLVGVLSKKIDSADKLFLLSISPTGTDLRRNLNLVTCEDASSISPTFTDRGNISNFDLFPTNTDNTYSRIGFGVQTSDNLTFRHNENLERQIYHYKNTDTSEESLLILHPIETQGPYASFALVVIPDYTEIGTSTAQHAPVMQYLLLGTSVVNTSLGLNAWNNTNYFTEPQFIETESGKLFIIYKNTQNGGLNNSFGSYSYVEVDLTNINKLKDVRNLVGWNTVGGQRRETAFFDETFAQMSNNNGNGVNSGRSTYVNFSDESQNSGSALPQQTYSLFAGKTCKITTPSAGNEGILKINVTGRTAGEKIKISGKFLNFDRQLTNSTNNYFFKIYAEDSLNQTISDTKFSTHLTSLYPNATYSGNAIPACTITSNEARYRTYTSNNNSNWAPFELIVEATDSEVNFFLEAVADSSGTNGIYITALSITVDDVSLKANHKPFSSNVLIGNPKNTVTANNFLQISKDNKSFAYSSDDMVGSIPDTNDPMICVDDFNEVT
jgi:hypothetical protein